MTEVQIAEFEVLQGQLEALHKEMTALSKKSTSDPLNQFKLKLVNKLLLRANKLFDASKQPVEEFSQFEDEMLPSNSDVLMVVGQYLSAFENVRAENIAQGNRGHWCWYLTDEKGEIIQLSEIRTAPPKKIAEKR